MSKQRVLLLHTGGTLGMAPGAHGALQPADARALTELVPEIAQLADIETRVLFQLDSSDVGPPEWAAIAGAVAEVRERVSGIVVIHGTDTMAYTAAALSFALSGLDRPVILTGSQRPLGEVRTDARRNLVDAVDLARRDLPEVGVCFDGRLLRGNRATKGDAWSYAAFASPGCPPLARLGIDVEIASHVRRPSQSFRCDARFDPRVAVLHALPGMEPAAVDRLAAAGYRGIVLAAFGVGNVPLRACAIAPAIRAATDAGITVLVVSQAHAGTVDLSLYQNGRQLLDAGALAGGDLRLEAASVKLMHALALHPDDAAARASYLEADVAGERGDGARHLRD